MKSIFRLMPLVALLVVSVFTLGITKEIGEESDRKDRTRSAVVEQSKTASNDFSIDTPSQPSPTTPTAPETGEQIKWWVIAGGGGYGESASYQLSGTVGQPAVDFGESASYQLQSGFWQSFLSAAPTCCVARVGDANSSGDDEPTISDISVMIDAKFITGTCTGTIACLAEADINQTGGLFPTCDDVTISDISYLIDYLFITGSSLGLPDCL